MATPTADSYSAASGAVVEAGRVASYALRTVESDGIITPGSQPSAWVKSGALYLGWVDSSGNTGVTKHDLAANTSQRTTLTGSPDYNSHNNAVLDWTSDNRLIATWSKHNSGEYVRARVAAAPLSVDSFGAASMAYPGDSTSYANTWRLSETGLLYVATRVGGSGLERPTRVMSGTDAAAWYSARTWVSNPGARPYAKFLSNGVNRVDVVYIDGGPGEMVTSLYHGYMQLVGGVERFFRTDGTDVGTGGLTPANSTLVADNSGGTTWSYDVAVGPDGELWCIYYRFPSTSDHRVMFVKTTGGRAAWGTPIQIAVAGARLYAAEAYSHAGAVFDATDPRIIWACLRNGNPKHEVFKYETADLGASWAQTEQCTSGSTHDNFQIVSPVAHGGLVRWVACHGVYTSWYQGYNCAMRAWVRN